MFELIDLNEYSVRTALHKLLEDKTTGKNIIFATDDYSERYPDITEKSPITESVLLGFHSCDIQPRVFKSQREQAARTKKKAEVFTPAWIVNKMNNHIDAEWFGRDHVFNAETENGWKTNAEKISFPKGKNLREYIDSTRLEITCGEAPYIVSRYDAANGNIIPLENRIGILDRKIRVINERINSKKEWFSWVHRAFKSVYGYEYQGDNLLIARINLLLTFCDYAKLRWNEKPSKRQLLYISDIIAWNFWQMDGLIGTVPGGKPGVQNNQISIFDLLGDGGADEEDDNAAAECVIFDWKKNTKLKYNDLKNAFGGPGYER